MTQLDLALPPMHAISLYCRINGQLSQWDAHAADIGGAIAAVQEEVQSLRAPHSTVLALVHKPLPVANTTV